MDKNNFFLITILNCVITISWVVIAVIFNKWWLALFAGLFVYGYNSSENIHLYHRVCDECGKKSPNFYTKDEVIPSITKLGWVHKDNDKDFCPECARKMYFK